MSTIPTGNRIVPFHYQNDAATKVRLASFPAIVISPNYPFPDAASITALRASAAADGNPNIKVLSYGVINDISAVNSAIPPAVLQVITDNPQFVLLQANTAMPIAANYSSGLANGMASSRLARNVVDSSGRTYADAYVDIMWATIWEPHGYDGVMIDEWFPGMTHSGIWTNRTAGTIASGTTATSITTSGPSLINCNATIGRFLDGPLAGTFFFVGASVGSVTTTTAALQVTLPSIPIIGNTFEILNRTTGLTAIASGFTGLNADLFNDGRAHNLSSAAANDEMLFVQQQAVRRLKALATAAGRPDFIITYNMGPGAGRYAYMRELVADGMLHGILYEGFYGQSYSEDPASALSLVHEIGNTMPPVSAGGFPMAGCASTDSVDYTKMRQGYALVMMADAWCAPGLNAMARIIDEYRVDLSVPVDPPQKDAQPAGHYLRRYQGGAAVFNPTLATITGITVPGYRKFDSRVAPYLGQVNAFNDGATSFDLLPSDGAILVPG